MEGWLGGGIQPLYECSQCTTLCTTVYAGRHKIGSVCVKTPEVAYQTDNVLSILYRFVNP